MGCRFLRLKCLLVGITVIWIACEGNSKFELKVINTLQSSEFIRVDLGGEVRALNIGDITFFRSVTSGRHILSIEGTTCAGTIRDTLTVNGDTTVRYLVTRDPASGECLVQAVVTATKIVSPVSMMSP